MGDKTLKTKKERLIELYIKNYITKTQYYEILQRIKNK